MSRISETCSCGAKFEGDSLFAHGFRKDHRHEPPPTQQAPEPESTQPETGFHVADHTGYLVNAGDAE